MYILFKDNLLLHFWDQICIVVFQDSTQIHLNDIETYFIEKVLANNLFEDVCAAIAIENDMTEKETLQVVKELLTSLQDVLYLSELESTNSIKVTGERGKYFPIHLCLSLTNSCPQKCVHCYKGEQPIQEELEIAAIVDLLEFCKGKVPFLQLTGGEPLLYSAINTIFEQYGKEYSISVTTSGAVLNSDLLMDLRNVSLVQISLYSHMSEKHDWFAGLNGSYATILNNIKELKKKDVFLKVSSIITQYNIDKIEQFVKLCIELGVNAITFGIVKSLGRAQSANDIFVGLSEIQHASKQINKLKSKYSKSIFIDDWEIEKHDKKTDDIFQCGAGKTLWTIMENGDIQPCGFIVSSDLSMGSIYSKDYEKLVANKNIYLDMVNIGMKEHLFDEIYEDKLCDNFRV